MIYRPVMPIMLAVALVAGCRTTDHRIRTIARGETEKVLTVQFDQRADDYVQTEASRWAGWLAGAAGVAGVIGGGGVVNAWKESRKGKAAKA